MMRNDSRCNKKHYIGNALFYATLASIGSFAHATDITISDAQTTKQTVSTGDSITITETGSLTLTGDSAIDVSTGADAVSVSNAGTISSDTTVITVGSSSTISNGIINSGTIDGGLYGAYLRDNSVVSSITNSGVMNAEVIGIYVYGSITDGITNSGTIDVTSGNGGDQGIEINSSVSGGITNTGTIAGNATRGAGVIVGYSGSTLSGGLTNSGLITGERAVNIARSASITGGITNTGTIAGNATDGSGISVGYTDAILYGGLTNSGLISGEKAIEVAGSGIINGAITNSGTISGVVGIEVVDESGAINGGIINSGSIIGTGGTAIDYGDTDNNSLTLNRGSIIDGTIAFGEGTGNSITIGDGHASATYSYSGNLDAVTALGGAVAVKNSNTVAVVSSSGFESIGNMAVNSSVNIGSLVSSRLTTMRIGDAPSYPTKLATSGTIANDVDNGLLRAPKNRTFWAEAFGAYQERSAYRSIEATDNRTAGAVFGVDMPWNDTTRIGAFIGGLSGSTHVGDTITIQKTDSSGGFGGGYMSVDMQPYSIDASITVGTTENDSQRSVGSGTSSEIARATYDDVFITPSISIGRALNSPVGPLVSSVTLRYTGQWVDGYSETGLTLGNLTVDDRYLHTASGRIQLETANKATPFSNGMLKVNSRVGIEANAPFSEDDVDITVLGQNVSVKSNSRDHNADGFIGLNVSYDIENSMNVYADVEATASISDTAEDNLGGLGKIGVRFKF